MTCAQAMQWLCLYADGRLETRYLAALETHLHACPSCCSDLALLETVGVALVEEPMVAEPANLSELVMRRIADFEVRRVAAVRARAQAGERALRVCLVTVLICAALAVTVLQPAALSSVSLTLSRSGGDLLQTLLAPGPDAISWAVWGAGALVVATLILRVWRTDASTAWRRSLADELAERLPQLW